MLAAALLVIPVIAVEQSDVGDPWRAIAAIVNWVIWLVFLAEFVTMLSVVANRWRWLRDHPLEAAVVVLTPPFLPPSLQAARALRLLRLVRLLRLMKVLRRLFSFEGLRYAALLAAMTALGGGAAFAAAEDISTWDGVYWAVTTMTTVGYGDITPETNEGRLIAMGVMVIGIGFLSLIIGAIAERFVAEEVAEIEDEMAEDTDAAEEMVRELRMVRQRLEGLEVRVQRLSAVHRSSSP